MVERVDICGINYEVRYVDVVPKPEGMEEQGELLGLIEYAEQVIYIKNGQGDDHKRSTLLHEVLHGAGDRAGVSIPEEDIERMELPMYHVVKYNPEFLEYVSGGRVVTRQKYEEVAQKIYDLQNKVIQLETENKRLKSEAMKSLLRSDGKINIEKLTEQMRGE